VLAEFSKQTPAVKFSEVSFLQTLKSFKKYGKFSYLELDDWCYSALKFIKYIWQIWHKNKKLIEEKSVDKDEKYTQVKKGSFFISTQIFLLRNLASNTMDAIRGLSALSRTLSPEGCVRVQRASQQFYILLYHEM
jgi:hypothetical protein